MIDSGDIAEAGVLGAVATFAGGVDLATVIGCALGIVVLGALRSWGVLPMPPRNPEGK